MTALQLLPTPNRSVNLAPEAAPTWAWSTVAGRFVEVCGVGAAAGLSAATALVADAQAAGEPVAWVTGADSVFHAPDLAADGVDLDALAVVRVPRLDVGRPDPAADTRRVVRAAELLVRSGGFGLVVLDLVPVERAGVEASAGSRWRDPSALRVDPALLSRLVQSGLAHGCAVVVLTATPATAPSIDALVSLRVEASRARVDDGRYVLRLRAVKDKRRGPGWSCEEVWGGPPGLP